MKKTIIEITEYEEEEDEFDEENNEQTEDVAEEPVEDAPYDSQWEHGAESGLY